MADKKDIFRAFFAFLVIQAFAWVQISAAAHIHDHQTHDLNGPHDQALQYEKHDHHHHDHNHHDHGFDNNKDNQPADPPGDQPGDHEAPACSLCIVAAQNEADQVPGADEPSSGGPDYIFNTLSFAGMFTRPDRFTWDQSRVPAPQTLRLLRPSRAPPVPA